MDKIKKIFKMLILKAKKHLLVSSIIVFLMVMLILLFPIFHSNWLAYPESLRTRVALKRLIDSFKYDIHCREDCSLKRLMYKDVISKSLKSNPEIYYKLLEKEILNPSLSEEGRRELLRICKDKIAERPNTIKDFISNTDNDWKIRMQLIKAWPESFPSFYSEIIGRYKKTRIIEDKLILLKMLDQESDPKITSLIWDILLSNDDQSLKRQAFFLLANTKNQKESYVPEDLYKLKTILQDATYPARLKDQVIFLIDNYYEHFPSQSADLLIEIINSAAYDNYHKTFAINILNKYRSVFLPLPGLTQEDWDFYYND